MILETNRLISFLDTVSQKRAFRRNSYELGVQYQRTVDRFTSLLTVSCQPLKILVDHFSMVSMLTVLD